VEARTGSHSRDQGEEIRMIRRTGAGVAQLQDHKLGCYDRRCARDKGHSLGVSRIIDSKQGKVEECVREGGAHDFLGSPLT